MPGDRCQTPSPLHRRQLGPTRQPDLFADSRAPHVSSPLPLFTASWDPHVRRLHPQSPPPLLCCRARRSIPGRRAMTSAPPDHCTPPLHAPSVRATLSTGPLLTASFASLYIKAPTGSDSFSSVRAASPVLLSLSLRCRCRPRHSPPNLSRTQVPHVLLGEAHLME
jgi:hypothetical protein